MATECEKRSLKSQIFDKIRVENDLARCLLAEFYGTFILAVFVRGALAEKLVSGGGPEIGIAITIGFGLCFAIHSSFGVSGGHVNLAVTFGLAAAGEFPWRRVPSYFFAQLLGGFLASAVTYGLYYDAFNDFDDGMREAFNATGTAAVFAAFPQPYLTLTSGFFEHVFNTSLLLAIVAIILDKMNAAPPIEFAPLYFGIGVTIIIMSFGHNAAAPLNPSVDLAGRLLLTVAGYGPEVWMPYGMFWWWVPIVGPCMGGALGFWSYLLFVGAHHPPPSATEKTQMKEVKSIDSKGTNNPDFLDEFDDTSVPRVLTSL